VRRRDVLKGIMGVLVVGPSATDVLLAEHAPKVVPISPPGISKTRLVEIIDTTLRDMPKLWMTWWHPNAYELCRIYQGEYHVTELHLDSWSERSSVDRGTETRKVRQVGADPEGQAQ
jgi:hypothetical protein